MNVTFVSGCGRVNTILLLVIAVLSPWTVHLAPPKQRPLALVGVVAVFLLYGIFAANPLTRWEMWAGLAVGIISVLFFASNGGGRQRPSRRPRREPFDDNADGHTGEIR